MALVDYIKSLSKPSTTSYSSLVNSPVKSSGTPLIAPKPTSFTAAPAPYIAPVKNYTPYVAPTNTRQASFGGGGGGMATNQGGVPAAPAPPPPPPKPPIDYSTYSDDQLAGVDSPFMDQKAMFKNALDKFLLEDTRQRGEIGRDRDTAIAGIDRNEVSGLTSMNEDFAARGLGKSGLRLGAIGEATEAYGRQRTNVRDGFTKSEGDLNARKEKMGSDTTNSIAAARREAYARLAAKQELT